MIRGMAILLTFQAGGELISSALGLPFPGSVIGMVLLLVALRFEWIRLDWIEQAAELLLSHLALFFVPAGVGVMVYTDVLANEWLPILAATVVSTFVVMAVTGKLADRLEKKTAADD